MCTKPACALLRHARAALASTRIAPTYNARKLIRTCMRSRAHAHLQRVSGKAEQLWHNYLASLDRRPIATKAVTSVFISTLGDVISQVLTARSKGMPFIWDLQVSAGGGRSFKHAVDL
jgi:hypothetical protein